MLMKVVVENGVKKLVPLTADAGSGNPCGTIITTLSNTVPSGYLPLGAQFDTTQFPVLYAILGSDTIPTASALGLPTLSAGRYVIKATSGINENQADNVLSALTPIDQVALNNLHSVTSNAVAQALSSLIKVKKVTFNNVVLNQNGVLNIESYIPSDINLLFALMWNWGAVSMDNYFGVSGDGRYIRGTPNNTIDWIVVAYFYVD